MTIWRMRIACWIPKATDTHSEYEYLLLFHCKNGYMNVPQCYVKHTFSFFLTHCCSDKYDYLYECVCVCVCIEIVLVCSLQM
jgi:hypothetical protein